MDYARYVPLPKPLPIRDQEWPEDIVPLVSVSCTTFNHIEYIRDCLQGFLMQETTFPVEILVHDDASSDGTGGVIREYAEAFPRLIKPILQTENQYSQRKPTSSNNYRRARGRYVAICEGDDYWVDPLKLEKQAIALERNPNIDLSIHSAYRIDVRTQEKSVIGRYRSESGIVSAGSVITKEHGTIPTASSFLRRPVLLEVLEFRKTRPYLTVADIYLHFFGAKRGGAFYIDEPLSVYRVQVPGSWNERVFSNPQARMQHVSARTRSYYELDKFTEHRHSSYFMDANSSWARGIIRSEHHGFTSKAGFYFRNFQYLRFRDALLCGGLVLASPCFPAMRRMKRRFINT